MEITYKLAETKEEIRNWVVLHGGRPAIINDPEISTDKVGIRIDWPGKKDESLLSEDRHVTKDITWDEFFAIMDRENLGFEYAEEEGVAETWSYRLVNLVK